MSVFAFLSIRTPKAKENKPREKKAIQDPPGIDLSTILKTATQNRTMAVNTQRNFDNP